MNNPNYYDGILQGITFEDLITAVQSNEEYITPATIRKVYDEILAIQQRDARHILREHMEFILREAKR